MSHEVSETIQDPVSRKWVNVFGKGTPNAGKRLPPDDSGVGHEEYDSVESAVEAAKTRSRSVKKKRPLADVGGPGILESIR